MATVTITEPTETQNKRKASSAGLAANSRPVKRRASKACCCCRARKVRCDVVENGSPCTNCRLDQVDCVVTESKRRKFVALVFAFGVRVKGHRADRKISGGCRKSRVDAEHASAALGSPAAEASDESSELFGRRSVSQGLPDLSPPSPSQLSVDLDHVQHMPHLICQFLYDAGIDYELSQGLC